MDFYGGPNYELQAQYASMLVVVSTALLFGPCFPVLYVVCMVRLIIFYCVERFNLFYLHREPPSYDDGMTRIALRILALLPPVMLLVSFW